MELVGLYAYSEDKVGRDVGDLAGLGRTLGVAATDDIDEIIALRPDCVSYMPLVPDIGVMARCWVRGSTSSRHRSSSPGAPTATRRSRRCAEPAQAGNASVFGSGINPGLDRVCRSRRVESGAASEHVRITESYNLSLMASDANMDDSAGAGPRVIPATPATSRTAGLRVPAMPPTAMGNRVTAMPAINAIPAVVAAPRAS